MTSSRREAFRWWNIYSGNVEDIDSLPYLPTIRVAQSVWSQTCPVFLLFVINQEDVKVYWDGVRAIVAMFTTASLIPSPVENFPDFIERVYSLRSILAPETVPSAIKFINKFVFHDKTHFLLYQLPLFLSDPGFYFRTVLELRNRKHTLWTSFVSRPANVDVFFNMHCGFLVELETSALPESWSHRVVLTELLLSFIQDVFRRHTDIMTLSKQFLDLTVPLMNAPLIPGAPIVRAVLTVMQQMVEIIPHQELKIRAMAMVRRLDESASPHEVMVFKFLLGQQKPLVSGNQILDIIASRGMRGLEDVEMVRKLVTAQTANIALYILFRGAAANRWWVRMCFRVVNMIIHEFGSRTELKEYVISVIRKFFVFISLAAQKQKYSMRVLMLCECISALERIDFLWVRHSIAACAAAAAAKGAPQYFRAFFMIQGVHIDDLALRAIEGKGHYANLKTFAYDSLRDVPALITVKEEDRLVIDSKRIVRARSGCDGTIARQPSGRAKCMVARPVSNRSSQSIRPSARKPVARRTLISRTSSRL